MRKTRNLIILRKVIILVNLKLMPASIISLLKNKKTSKNQLLMI
jgi:hypothetical protein